MLERKTTIEVFETSDGSHIVQVTFHEGAIKIGMTQLPGGNRENATGIAEGLQRLAARGLDLTGILPTGSSAIPQVIGSETTYVGTESRLGGHGARVLVTGIFRYDEPTDSPDRVVRDNTRLSELGGLRSRDGAEVHVWQEPEARWGFVSEEVCDIFQLQISSTLEICPRNKSKTKG